MISTERLMRLFIEVADSLVGDFDVVEFLLTLTEHAADVSGADAVGVMLADELGSLRFMAASNEQGRLLELFQVQHSEGPCLDCFITKEPVVNADLSAAGGRWPKFAPSARDAGIQSVHAFPMRLQQDVIGALNIFSTSEGDFADDDVRVVQALADIATIALLQERSTTRSGVLTEQLQWALNARITIEQAKGALAQRHGTSPDEAFGLLRSQARSEQKKLAEVAEQILTRG